MFFPAVNDWYQFLHCEIFLMDFVDSFFIFLECLKKIHTSSASVDDFPIFWEQWKQDWLSPEKVEKIEFVDTIGQLSQRFFLIKRYLEFIFIIILIVLD